MKGLVRMPGVGPPVTTGFQGLGSRATVGRLALTPLTVRPATSQGQGCSPSLISPSAPAGGRGSYGFARRRSALAAQIRREDEGNSIASRQPVPKLRASLDATSEVRVLAWSTLPPPLHRPVATVEVAGGKCPLFWEAHWGCGCTASTWRQPDAGARWAPSFRSLVLYRTFPNTASVGSGKKRKGGIRNVALCPRSRSWSEANLCSPLNLRHSVGPL